jgi:hypothetical protein
MKGTTMAHRHKLHRAHGGRTVYSGAGSNVAAEADKGTDGFKRGGHKKAGGKVVGRAFGGRAKRSAGFKRGGSVFSHAHGKFGGVKGFAAPPHHEHGDHGEKLDHAASRDSSRKGHAGREAHQHADGGVVEKAAGGSVTAKKKGGAIAKRGGGGCKMPEAEEDGEEEEERAHGGGIHKRGGGMRYVGGKGRHKKDGGHIDIYKTTGGTHYWKDIEESAAGGGKWIQGAIKHPGALHKQLGVPQGEKIPAKKLAKATHSDNPTLARRANLAKTLKGLHS